MSRALGAEWLKLRTIRSTAWALLSLAGASLLLTALTCGGSTTEGGSPGHPGDNDIVLDSLSGLRFGQIAAAVFAVLAITSEYSTRMIRATLAAEPRRGLVLTAKACVVVTIVLLTGLARARPASSSDSGCSVEAGSPTRTATPPRP